MMHGFFLAGGMLDAGRRAVAQSAAWRCAKRSRQSSRVRAEYRPTGLEK
jgi:hypothetical protein